MFKYKVYSLHSSDAEPHLEGSFRTEQEAQSYVECWESLYNSMELWIDASPH